jgi:FixJ family two-component response regulator
LPARKLVIVLDDDPGVLRAVQRLLAAGGFDCELFSSVRDFQIGARLHLAECVVLDINLDSESGIEVRRKLTAKWPSIPVIFITGNDSDGARRAAMEAGCIAYLTKPFSSNSLLDAIEKASALQPLPLKR